MAAPLIPLNKILAALDRKDRDFYDKLPDELKKSFSGFLMLRYSATVEGVSPELAHYYVASTNHYANKHMFSLSRHPKLQWLMLTAASPGLGVNRHTWIKQKPKPKNATGPIKKQLASMFPAMKDVDLDVLSTLVTKKEMAQHIKDCG
jgi:hypothetical protein